MFKPINIGYQKIGALLKFAKFVFNFFNFIKIRINIGKLI